MGKKSETGYYKKEWKRFTYRWEFMRRSAEYQADYSRFDAACKNLWKEGSPDRYKYLRDQEIYFFEKYGLTHPLDPSVSLLKPPTIDYELLSLEPPEGKSRRKKKSPQYDIMYQVGATHSGAICLTPDRHIIGWDPDGNYDWEPLTDEELRDQKSIDVQINLDAPDKRIKEDLKKIVADWQTRRAKAMKGRRYRARVFEYARYLKGELSLCGRSPIYQASVGQNADPEPGLVFVIEPIRKFIQIKWEILDRHLMMCADKAALENGPEAFDAICVN